jgi:far upstream element-binding protein
MADDGELSAVEEYDATRVENKRKFDDAGGVVVAVVVDQSASKFHNNAAGSDGDAVSAAAAAAPVSYNNVAPPMSEFELAKQRAELIAARLVTGAELKRPRTDDSFSEEQQNGVDGRASGTDFDQGFPGNLNKLDILNSFGIPDTMFGREVIIVHALWLCCCHQCLTRASASFMMLSLVRRACCCFQNAAQIRLIFP